MPNLDIYLQDNGLLEYSRDLALTQYSTNYTIRLLSKKLYYIVNMNVTTGSGLDTYRKSLIVNTRKNIDGYYEYSYTLGQDITGYEFSGDKSTIKIAFYLYPDENNLNNVTTTSIVYLPLLKSIEDRPTDGSITNSELSLILSEINQLKGKLADLGYGETESAKDYNPETGTIKSKFEEIEAGLGNLQNLIETLDSRLGTYTDPQTGEITQTVASALAQLELTRLQLIEDLDEVQEKLTQLDTRLDETQTFADQISEIRDSISAGLKYNVVQSLPGQNERREGVVYLIPDNTGSEDNVYTEYMWVSNHWEKIGTSRTEIDLSNYATLTDVASVATGVSSATQSINNLSESLNTQSGRIDSVVSSINTINTELDEKADKATTLAGYGITDGAKKTEVSNAITNLRSELTGTINEQIGGLRTDTEEGFTRQGQELIELGNNLRTTNNLANEAYELALSRVYSKAFEDLDELKAWLRVLPGSDNDHKLANLGTDLYIKDPNVPDYWISAYKKDSSNNWAPISDVNDPFYGSYYEVKEIEVNLGNYYNKGEIDDKEDAIQGQIDSVNDAIDEINNNKTQVIRDTVSPDGVLKYPSETAVKTYVDGKIEGLAQDVEDTYETKLAHNQDKEALQAALTEESERAIAAEEGLSDDIEAVASDLTTEISRATSAENAITADLNTYKTNETAARIQGDADTLRTAASYASELDQTIRHQLGNGVLTPYQAEGVKDFVNNDRIRFTTDVANKDFEITATDITDIQAVLSWLEPNQYN